MAKPLVVIFARAPRYGAVKTRLARDIGAGETIRFYRNTMARLVRRLRADPRFETVLAVTPDAARDGRFWPGGVRVSGQGDGDLGRRMMRALRRAGARPAVVVGSDIPGIEPFHLREAFAALGARSIVLGPARDGGYWLIGARHPQRLRAAALDGVRWSSAHAMGDTIARLGAVALLDLVLDDVDDGGSYRRATRRQ
jgi:hypothetical protein